MNKIDSKICKDQQIKWVVKYKDPIDKIIETGVFNIKNCENIECRALYSQYLKEKANVQVLKDCLEIEKNDSKAMILQVEQMENKYENKIEELVHKNDLFQKKINELQQNLEIERKLRMEDIYKIEFHKVESEELFRDNTILRKELTLESSKIPELEKEIYNLKNVLSIIQDKNKFMYSQLQVYEHEITKLDDINIRLRLRLNNSDDKISSILKNNSSSITQIPSSYRSSQSMIDKQMTRKSTIKLKPL